jgi:hypothetical protein
MEPSLLPIDRDDERRLAGSAFSKPSDLDLARLSVSDIDLILEKPCSIGFKSGEKGGR